MRVCVRTHAHTHAPLHTCMHVARPAQVVDYSLRNLHGERLIKAVQDAVERMQQPLDGWVQLKQTGHSMTVS